MSTNSPENVSAIETHLSEVFLGSDRVYKRLKPVKLPFVDLTTAERRCHAAEVEFQQNHAISPRVYLGLAEVVENGQLVDRLIVMKRLAARDELTGLVHQAGSADVLRSVARRIARLHMGAAPLGCADAAPASAEAVSQNWEDNFAALEPLVGSVIEPEVHERIMGLVRRWIEGRSQLFQDRVDAGWVRVGHGDLRAEHVYVTPQGVELIDCVAFDDNLRVADVLGDVAFLAMDLERLVGPNPTQLFMRAWAEFTGESHPSSLAHFYVAYRAHVRAKVAGLRVGQGDREAEGWVRRYLDLCVRHLELASIRVVIVGGGPGTGKSTIAERVAGALGASWVRADEIRKDLAGLGHDAHAFSEPGEGIYSPEMQARTQQEVRRQAEELLTRGVSVVLDSTFASDADRSAIRDLAAEVKVDLTELRCELDPAITRERIARRMSSLHNPSDATPAVVDYVNRQFEPWPEATSIDTANRVEDSVSEALHAILCTVRTPVKPTADHLRSLREFILVVGSMPETSAPPFGIARRPIR